MEVIRLQLPNQYTKEEMPPLSLAIGYFDGVHIGHQQVINTAKQEAEQNGWKSAVMTFDPSPKAVLGKNPENVKYITLLSDKMKRIENLGIDYLFVVPFTKELANLLPEQFVDEYLLKLNVKHVVAGFDYTYGKFGKGTMETMKEQAQGKFTVSTVGKVSYNDEKISSTTIRELIQNGDVDKVPNYLGDFFRINGKVIHGKKRGRTLGFPTANLQVDSRYCLPKNGVYIVKFFVNGKWEKGVCSIGHNPTFNDGQNERFIETYLLNFSRDIYYEEVVLEWHKRIRDELKFDDVKELIEQMENDVQETIAYFQ